MPVAPTSNRLRHLAIIPDGNRRWARLRQLPDEQGHAAGVDTFWKLLPAILDTNVEFVTLYLFSTENWARPAGEVNALMRLLTEFFHDCVQRSSRMGFTARVIGDLGDGRIPRALGEAIDSATRSSGSGATVTFAVNYGAIRDARTEPQGQQRHAMATVSGLPDVDLLLRSGGQHRLSNFLLLESAYAELSFLDQLWPDLQPSDLIGLFDAFRRRHRTFGG